MRIDRVIVRLAVRALAALAAAWPAYLGAQAYQCAMPRSVEAPVTRPDGPVRTTPVTGYTMALSWSPEFCKPRQGQRAHALQCSGRNGRFGFVVHGLWPDSGRTWPQWCPANRRPTGVDIARQLCMSPSARLVSRQWAKHGSCMTRRPDTYFKVTRILWNSYRWPDFDRISREEGLTAGRIREAFASANPGWEPNMVGVKLNRRGWLQELRLCYGKRFRPARCDSRTFGPRDGMRAKIWRGL